MRHADPHHPNYAFIATAQALRNLHYWLRVIQPFGIPEQTFAHTNDIHAVLVRLSSETQRSDGKQGHKNPKDDPGGNMHGAKLDSSGITPLWTPEGGNQRLAHTGVDSAPYTCYSAPSTGHLSSCCRHSRSSSRTNQTSEASQADSACPACEEDQERAFKVNAWLNGSGRADLLAQEEDLISLGGTTVMEDMGGSWVLAGTVQA